MIFHLDDPDKIRKYIRPRAELAEFGEFRQSGLHGEGHADAEENKKCGAKTGDSCLLPPGTLVYGSGRFFESVGHYACGFHLRPVDHGGEGRWPCISERAVNRTYHPVMVFEAGGLRPATGDEFRRALGEARA